ncbi:hypothetical protein NECID01_0305 [Nematocida sp. AWRm77]|nr:hypothetical protein NECID01_0305 [Nematocida sp. AWRm77]
MKVLSIDVGSYKAVMASSDTSAGEVVLMPSGSRSIRMAVDYRGKKRSFGLVGNSYKNRHLVSESIQKEVFQYAENLASTGQAIPKKADKSPLYDMVSHLVGAYAARESVRVSEIELELIVPSTFTEVHRQILSCLVKETGVASVSVDTDSQALGAYYLSRCGSGQTKLVLVADVGDTKTTSTLFWMEAELIRVLGRETVQVGGSLITESLFKQLYLEVVDVPECFSFDEFKMRNKKTVEWIKNALAGLPEIKTSVDATYDRSVNVTVKKEEVEERYLGMFAEMQRSLARLGRVAETVLAESEKAVPFEVQITGGSSRLFFVPGLVESALEGPCRDLQGQCRAQVQMNADEAVALGGVYRKLMESTFHRFRFDPVIEDQAGAEYCLDVCSPGEERRVIPLFGREDRFFKNQKAKVVGAAYDKTIKLVQPLKKVVKLSKVTKDTFIVLYCGGYPLYEVKLKEKEEEKEKEKEKEKEECGDGVSASEEALKSKRREAEAPGAPGEGATEAGATISPEKEEGEGSAPASLPSMVVWLNEKGCIMYKSADFELVSIVEKAGLGFGRVQDEKHTLIEAEIEAAEDRLNTCQTSLFKIVDMLSSTSLKHLPSAEKISGMLTEQVMSMPMDVKTQAQVAEWEKAVEKAVGPLVQAEWTERARATARDLSQKYSIDVQVPSYPGVLSLYPVEEYLLEKTEKEKAEADRRRMWEEKVKKEKEGPKTEASVEEPAPNHT